jgi:hypothetical protein
VPFTPCSHGGDRDEKRLKVVQREQFKCSAGGRDEDDDVVKVGVVEETHHPDGIRGARVGHGRQGHHGHKEDQEQKTPELHRIFGIPHRTGKVKLSGFRAAATTEIDPKESSR